MAFEHFPHLEPIRAATDAKIKFKVKNTDGTVRDYSGATPVATVTPEIGSAFNPTAALESDATSMPQFNVTILDTETSGLTTPQVCRLAVVVTLASGLIDKPSATFDLVA